MVIYTDKQRRKTKQSIVNLGYMDPDKLHPSSIIPNGKGKLAICIPTYRSQELVDELLQRNMKLYQEYETDLYIYDSSDNDFTWNIVKKWMELYDNLYYVRFPPGLHSNMKVYKILQRYSWYKDYDYIWIQNDSIRVSEEVFLKINTQLKCNYDIIVVNGRDKENLGDREYCDPLLFAKECGWHLTMYGAALVNTHTILEDVDWKGLQQKYNRPERINHSHLCFYLEKISTLKSFSAIHLSFLSGNIKASNLRAISGWSKDIFYVWGYCFPNAINALTDYYDKRVKKTIIKKNGICAGIFDILSLLRYREAGLYNIDVYREYKWEWYILTDIPLWKLRQIARMSLEQVKKEQLLIQTGKQKINRHRKQLIRLKKFAHRNKKLYIYGAGQCAIRYAGYLDEMDIEYAGFMVSDMAKNSTEINNHPVFELSDLNLSEENIGIILGLNPDNQIQVKKLLKERGISSNIFSEYIISI